MAAALLARVLSSLPRPRYLLSATCSVDKYFSKCISSDSRPKRPLTAYLRFFVDKQPFYRKQNPGKKLQGNNKVLGGCLEQLPLEHSQKCSTTYETAAKADIQRYKEQLAKFKAELTPAQEEALKEEKRRKIAKRRAFRKKRQLTILGKPKRSRSAFNIFMAEHFQEAKGVSPQGKMKYLFDEWKTMSSSQKQAYLQLAEDDKVRYKNEMILWEAHMKEIGHEDLIRHRNKGQMQRGERSKKTSENRFVILKESPLGKIVSRAKNKQKVKAKELEE
ncbi:hypothetical protein JRQ81_017224 [Phrynocephalus forsythii]|uniref:Transcription factor A, mitochondrial n=1 Tax=Phrynocephalus forsythii TaxID=171643 RepID=A0A9Q0XT81_9SAUR|nr:hypothetical protein JRQ81_017224 [Phrynocephalus forsythii]